MGTVAVGRRPSPLTTRLDGVGRALAFTVFALGASAVTTWIAFSTVSTGDYTTSGPVLGNNAAPALEGLAHGHLGALLADQPTMGLSSLLLRAPVVAIGQAFGAGDLLAYRLGAAACLLPLALLAAWVASAVRSAPPWRLVGLTAALVLLLSPAIADALSSGHPEDVLAAALATGAVLAATRGFYGWAAVLLGLAVGTMPWALIAAAPVLIALPERRAQTAVRAGALAAVLTLTLPLADPGAYLHALKSEGHTDLVNAFSLWWPLSSPFHLQSRLLAPTRRLPFGLARSSAMLITLALATALLTLVWGRASRRGRLHWDPLALLALLGLIRCVCDPTRLEYYYVAALIPLATWETASRRRPPALAALAGALLALTPNATLAAHPALVNSCALALKFALGAYLARQAICLGRSTGERRMASVGAAEHN